MPATVKGVIGEPGRAPLSISAVQPGLCRRPIAGLFRFQCHRHC
ncbi:hypothetical protein HMPREF1861_00309 [Corynebacterium kroppenstedtii]|nr:hypothetical protein HMPREF1861_00309 [Corynebacterium kroppenstedtii]